MKRNFKKLAVAGILVGAITIGGVTSISAATGNSYQDYKSAVIETVKKKNMTISSDIKVKQNGKMIIEGEVETQVSDKNKYSSGKIQGNNETIDAEMSISDKGMVNRIGDKYTSMSFENKNYDRHNMKDSSSGEKFMNTVTDVLVGDIKNNFTRDGENITVNLEESQVPELLNMAASTMIDKKSNKDNKNTAECEALENVFKQISITQNIKIKKINLNAKLDNGLVKENTINMIITGNDNAGAKQEIELTYNGSISNIGNTAPKTIDTTGKNVEEKTKQSFCK